jgi:phosphoribosylformimino-5-aminoimidazole carboxamide ribotide isomerase
MQLIGVVDLKAGRAVHARGGARERYVPVREIAGCHIDGDPLALARAYVERFSLTTIYVADLDAIAGAGMNTRVLEGLAAVAPVWIDAGISSPALAQQAINHGAAVAVAGLETLTSFDALPAMCAAIGRTRVAFSLDLRAGMPLVAAEVRLESPEALAARAVADGAGTLIVIDLARVGAGTGPDIDLMARVHATVPATPLFAGGGVRGADDLARLADAGCAGALIASVLHDGGVSTRR